MEFSITNRRLESLGARLDRFSARCRRAGIVDTPQRRLIYQCLVESSDHPTAETVHSRVRRRLARISLATVYRNLRRFADAGIIDEVPTGGSFARYDANQDRHHHLVCRACGSVADYYSERFEAVAPAGETIDGFHVHDTKVHLFGTCADCVRQGRGDVPDAGRFDDASASPVPAGPGRAGDKLRRNDNG